MIVMGLGLGQKFVMRGGMELRYPDCVQWRYMEKGGCTFY